MRNKVIPLIKGLFINWETSFRTLILFFIPLISLFSVMSDRTPYNYINIGLYAIEMSLIVFYVWKWKKFRFDVLTLCLIVFNITIFLSQLVNQRINEFPTTILLLSIFSIIFYQFAYSEENKALIYRLIVIGGLLFSIYFIYIYRNDILSLNFADRLGRDFSDQNDLAKYLAIFALLSIIEIFKTQKLWKIGPIISTIIFVLLMLISGSVSNLLCFIIIGILVLVFCSKRKNRLFVILGILVLAGLVFGLIQLPFMNYFKTRIDGIFNAFFEPGEKVDGSASDRIKLFVEGFKLFLTRPFLGYGYDQVQYYTHGIGMFSHSNIAELLASFGFVGFIAFEVLICYPLYYAFKNDKYKKEAVTTLFYLFIFQFFLIIFRKKIEFMLIPLGFSCIVGLDSRAVEISFNGFKTTFTNTKRVELKQKQIVLLAYSKEDNENEMLPIKTFKNLIPKNYEIKTCFIGEPDKRFKYDYVVRKNISKFKMKRTVMDMIDAFNPKILFASKNMISLLVGSTFGKSVKAVCFVDESDLQNKHLMSDKIYKVLCGQQSIISKDKKRKNLEKHVVRIETIENKEDFNNLFNLLKK